MNYIDLIYYFGFIVIIVLILILLFLIIILFNKLHNLQQDGRTSSKSDRSGFV